MVPVINNTGENDILPLVVSCALGNFPAVSVKAAPMPKLTAYVKATSDVH